MGSADFWQIVISALVTLGAVALGAWLNERAQTRARKEERERRDEELRAQRAEKALAELRAEARELASLIETLLSEMDDYTRRPSSERADRVLSQWQKIEKQIDFFVAGHYTPTTKLAADFVKQEFLLAAGMLDDHRVAVEQEASGKARATWRADETKGELSAQLVTVSGQVNVFLDHLRSRISPEEDDDKRLDDEEDDDEDLFSGS